MKNLRIENRHLYYLITFFGRHFRVPILSKIHPKFRTFILFNPHYTRRYEDYYFFRKLWKTFDCDFEKEKNILSRNLDEESLETLTKIFDFLSSVIDLEINNQPNFKSIRKLLNFYTITPQIKKIKREFNQNIKHNPDGTYSYKDLILPIYHFETSVFLHKHSINTLKTLDKIKNKNIIDAGAFIGDSALVFSNYSNKNIYSFEPSEKNFANIQKTIKLNNLKNVIPINSALGDIVNQKLYITGSDSCTQTIEIPTENQIASTTLDKFVEENNIDVGLIKVDIEGFEQKFLKGAENTIKKQKPALLISIYHNIDDFFHIKSIIESWNLGYTFRIAKPTESCILETLLVAEVLD